MKSSLRWALAAWVRRIAPATCGWGARLLSKLFPNHSQSDLDRLQRFQQEARVLSALNHPNLLAIYDVGVQDGVHYLVSELLEGQTLRERMNRNPLPQRKVTEYVLQLANGLAAAHDKEIVHRDLKPENVFVTRDERMKILDFGLAKQTRAAGTADTATLAATPTAVGVVMGTAGYMSPEQVRGQAVGHRSDIFSLGAILYEMISGKHAFHGESGVETMNAILKEEPPELAESGLMWVRVWSGSSGGALRKRRSAVFSRRAVWRLPSKLFQGFPAARLRSRPEQLPLSFGVELPGLRQRCYSPWRLLPSSPA